MTWKHTEDSEIVQHELTGYQQRVSSLISRTYITARDYSNMYERPSKSVTLETKLCGSVNIQIRRYQYYRLFDNSEWLDAGLHSLKLMLSI